MARKIVLHSDHVSWKTMVDEKFLEMCWKRPEEVKMAYIPSQSDLDWNRKYFNQKVSRYVQFWMKPENISYFDVDKEYDISKEAELFSNDAIFLSWGKTFHFLNNLKKRWFMEKLRRFVEKWWILIGLSAWGIIMSNHIGTAWNICNEINSGESEDLSSLGLLDFEFFPHFSWENETLQRLKAYSAGKSLYAVRDWDWIVINWNNIETIWDVVVFQNWEKR